MPQSLVNLQVLITFSTKYRQKLIDDELKEPLFAYIGGICKGLECYPIRVGGHSDHVHIYCCLSKKVTLIKLLEIVKKESSKWVKLQGPKYRNFYWQGGYHTTSVNPSQSESVIRYIENQEEHHRKCSYKEETRMFLKKYEMEFDEQYVWD